MDAYTANTCLRDMGSADTLDGYTILSGGAFEALAAAVQFAIIVREALAHGDLPAAQHACESAERECNSARQLFVTLERTIAKRRNREARVR